MNNKVINIIAFAVLALLWLGFFLALVFRPESLETIWQSFRGLPLLVQILVGLLTLPVTLGLWIWQTSWPVLLRLALVLGLAWVTVYTFFPRKAGKSSEAASTAPVKP